MKRHVTLLVTSLSDEYFQVGSGSQFHVDLGSSRSDEKGQAQDRHHIAEKRKSIAKSKDNRDVSVDARQFIRSLSTLPASVVRL